MTGSVITRGDLLYKRGEYVTTGFDADHKRCRRRVETVTEHQHNYSGWVVQLSPCVSCSQPSVIPQIDSCWVRRG